jgi:hypothetical protein
MKLTMTLAAMILAAIAATAWAQEADDDDEEEAQAAAAPSAALGGRTLQLGFAGLMDRSNRTDLNPLNLSAGVMESDGTYTLLSGGYYRINIISDGTQEISVEGPGFFRNVWINEVVINNLEVRPLGLDSLEFDDAGTIELSFIAITPGQYDIRIRGTTGETQRANFIIQ